MSGTPFPLAGKRLIAVLNSASGGCDSAAAERMRTLMHEALPANGEARPHVVVVSPKHIERALARAARTADVLVALGGDGTLRTAATLCARLGKPLVPLAGGTMNMLPRALYGDLPWDEALARTLAEPTLRPVSGGIVEKEMFFCAAILGAPSLWAEAREAVRRVRPVEAVRRAWIALRRSTLESLDYQLEDGALATAEAVAVICPLISRAMDAAEQSLEVAAVEPVAAASLFRLAFHALFDDWRRDPAVTVTKVRRLTAEANGRLPVILDGETVRMGRRVRVRFVSAAFQAVAPAGEC